MVRKYCRPNKSINTSDVYDYCRETTSTQWERDEDDGTVKKDDIIITKAAGFEIITIFQEEEVVHLVQVFLHGKYGI